MFAIVLECVYGGTMAQKPQWTENEHREIANVMQGWIIESLATRRGEYGKWAFHGGTALKQAYQSDRFSEDLDFMISPNLDTKALMNVVIKDVELKAMQTFGRGTNVRLKAGRDEKNPSHFTLVLMAPEHSASFVNVKVEFWETLHFPVYAKVSTQTSPQRALIRGIPMDSQAARIEVGSLEQIYVDKCFALTQRNYLKERDIWDLSWLLEKTPLIGISTDELFERMIDLGKCYSPKTGQEWLEAAHKRLEEMQAPDFPKRFQTHMQRWLSEPWRSQSVEQFEERALTVTQLLEGIITTLESKLDVYEPQP